MKTSPPPNVAHRGFHPRNRHAARYDFPTLIQTSPDLAPFVHPSPAGTDTIDFANPAAVLALNRALLKTHYGIAHWSIPQGYLCPPIPGRADYLHHLADLLAESNDAVIPRGPAVRILDVGVGANCIYPIIGVSEYAWNFVGTDIDATALASARQLIATNPTLTGQIECRLQPSPTAIFSHTIRPDETFTASICNPPFHTSPHEAAAGTLRKLRNLGSPKTAQPRLNFGGQSTELWCAGGEAAFIRRMIAESATRPHLCRWFTTLVAKRDNLPAIERALHAVRPTAVRKIDLAHGQKKSRLLAWTFAAPRKTTRPS